MHTRTRYNGTRRGGALLASAALLVGLLAAGGPSAAKADEARAEQAGAAPRTVAVVTVVRARDLMSGSDRRDYREQIREAPNAAARQRIHGQWLERLQARAAEHGVIMIIETRGPRPVVRQTETAAAAPAAPATVAAPTAPAVVAPAVVVRPAEPAARPLPPRAP